MPFSIGCNDLTDDSLAAVKRIDLLDRPPVSDGDSVHHRSQEARNSGSPLAATIEAVSHGLTELVMHWRICNDVSLQRPLRSLASPAVRPQFYECSMFRSHRSWIPRIKMAALEGNSRIIAEFVDRCSVHGIYSPRNSLNFEYIESPYISRHRPVLVYSTTPHTY